ncbi:hypothetical protein WME94_02240 [Sorangium sp. So ce429]
MQHHDAALAPGATLEGRYEILAKHHLNIAVLVDSGDMRSSSSTGMVAASLGRRRVPVPPALDGERASSWASQASAKEPPACRLTQLHGSFPDLKFPLTKK